MRWQLHMLLERNRTRTTIERQVYQSMDLFVFVVRVSHTLFTLLFISSHTHTHTHTREKKKNIDINTCIGEEQVESKTIHRTFFSVSQCSLFETVMFVGSIHNSLNIVDYSLQWLTRGRRVCSSIPIGSNWPSLISTVESKLDSCSSTCTLHIVYRTKQNARLCS
jgi:hypothetical protein